MCTMDKLVAARLAAVLRAQADVVAYQQAVTIDVTDSFLKWQIDARRWQRPHPHVYVAHPGRLCDDQRIWSAWAYCYPDGVVGCHSAALLHGLKGYADDAVHIWVPAGRQPRPRPGVRIHRTARLDAPGALQPTASLPRTRIERSLVDMANHATRLDDAVAILAAGVQQRLTTGPRLADELARRPRVHRRSALVDVCADLTGGSHSVIEVEAAQLLRRYRLPPPDRQSPLTLPDGLARVDCYWDRFRVVAELDGRMHLDVRQWVDDLHRQNELGLTQRLVLRYPLWLLRHHPDRVAEQLQRAFARAAA